jgi:hypothetical protein
LARLPIPTGAAARLVDKRERYIVSQTAGIDGDVFIRLTRAEALVLFEWLSRNDEGDGKLPFADPAEERVVWRIEGQLECKLAEPLAANYEELLSKARRAVLDSEQ